MLVLVPQLTLSCPRPLRGHRMATCAGAPAPGHRQGPPAAAPLLLAVRRASAPLVGPETDTDWTQQVKSIRALALALSAAVKATAAAASRASSRSSCSRLQQQRATPHPSCPLPLPARSESQSSNQFFYVNCPVCPCLKSVEFSVNWPLDKIHLGCQH